MNSRLVISQPMSSPLNAIRPIGYHRDWYTATNQQSAPELGRVEPANILQNILTNPYAEAVSDSTDDGALPVQDPAADLDDKYDYDYLKLLYDSLGNKKVDVQGYLQQYLDAATTGNKINDDQVAFDDVRRRLPRTKVKRKRRRRHVGPHDEGGLQRLISTGTLVSPLLSEDHPDYERSIDIVFATYWFYPAKTEALLPEDKKCIEKRMKTQSERFDPQSKYFGMDDDGFAHAITKECLAKSNHQLAEKGTYNNQHTYNPYNVHMGQLTVYRSNETEVRLRKIIEKRTLRPNLATQQTTMVSIYGIRRK
ncbi:hypothetical protein LSH36_186g01008 [Paralvinella palmiformis]|uniref:Uncharacterized protein n=1 Tax=Paralvinella palmiformis TaxID=53620 RepID=A0AAD9JQV0_9ANNE|nr:hypothetical protein LSH36_186g01008 [Paralvinella palmiformis]